jgi:hypothetical protein
MYQGAAKLICFDSIIDEFNNGELEDTNIKIEGLDLCTL